MYEEKFNENNFIPKGLIKAFQNISESFNVPIEIPYINFLVVSGALIGSNYAIRIKESYLVYNNLYLCVVGSSGI